MKTNNDKVFRYLSDQMDEKERAEFELELNSNSQLREELANTNAQLQNFSSGEYVVDETYFNNLIPIVRSKMEKKEKGKLFPRLAYGLPTLAIVIIAAVVLFKNGNGFKNGSIDVISEIVENIDNDAVSTNYITDLDIDSNGFFHQENDEAHEMSYDEKTKNKILTAYDYPLNEEMLSAQNLSQEELTSIYSNLVQKKY